MVDVNIWKTPQKGIVHRIFGSITGMACTAIAMSIFVRSNSMLKQRVYDQFSLILDSTEKLVTWYAGRVERKTSDTAAPFSPERLEDEWDDVENRLRT